MKVLWLTNIALPEVSQLMNEPSTPFGGWLVNASIDLSDQENIELSITFPRTHSNDISQFKGNKINYFSFPSVNMKNKKLIQNNKYLKKILNEVKPDLVHIFGTEYAHSLAMVNVCKQLGIETAINIQGLVSIISKHYTSGLPISVQQRYTFRDFLKQNNILQQQNYYKKSGELETEVIKKTNHIIGRTTWDKACTAQINPDAKYHFCNETLRKSFYESSWSFKNCKKYSIFMSQATYPIKGLHYVLEALPLIVKNYPETKLFIAGPNFIHSPTLKEKLKISSYTKYITHLIKKNNLINHVFFTGLLDEKNMTDMYCKSNVFVCSSTIENSPNSLGEAMLLGVPCVASDVGGVSDMLKHKEEGYLYQADAPYMLAHYICEIFNNEKLAISFSKKAKEKSIKTHDREVNTKRLIAIYNTIISN